MNDVSNRAVREFSEFLDRIEADFPKPTCTTAYEITMKSTIVSALITLDTEKQMDERFWNHLRVQRNILDFLYALWLDDDRTLVDEFSTIIKDLAPLSQMRYYRHGCRGYPWSESLSLGISGVPR